MDFGWNDFALSAYQMSCEALVAFGHAEATNYGARPRHEPRFPEALPRWDDVCCAIVALADQNGLLKFMAPESHGRQTSLAGRHPLMTIASSYGLGSALATPAVISVLEVLDLVEHDRWTAGAELILWREQPPQWRMDVTADPRFTAAVSLAATTMPCEIRQVFDRLITITDADVAEWLERRAQRQSVHFSLELPVVSAPVPTTAFEVRKRIAFSRLGELDWLFFRRWRLVQGWLTPDAAACALAIFHDPLAIAVRRGVVALAAPEARGFPA